MNNHNIVIRPFITEKANKLQESLNKYTFEVAIDATKQDIKKALQITYKDIQIAKINTMIVRGKSKQRLRKRIMISGYTKKWKKAIVTLKEGSSIDLFSEV